MGLYIWSRTAASNATADTTINWAEGMSPSGVNDSGRSMMARVAEWRDDIAGSITTGGSSIAYTVTSYQSFDTLAHMSGALIAFTPHTTSGASPTLAVDGLAAKAINIGNGVAVPTGYLLSGSRYLASYDNSNNQFLLVNPAGAGTTSSSDASTGYVGEYLESELLVASAVSLSTATAANITSLSVTAGDWNMWGTVGLFPAPSTAMSSMIGWVSPTSASLPTDISKGAYAGFVIATSAGNGLTFPIGMRRLAIASTTTMYLSCRVVFTVSTCAAFGIICARRMR